MSLVNDLKCDFLMTYDDTEEVKILAKQYNLSVQYILMKNTHNQPKKELLIGRNLEWLEKPGFSQKPGF